jgi:mRNA interferase RelE/StbE
MPARTLKTTSTVRTLIRHLRPNLKQKVRAALSDILADPHCGKPLKGELDGLWSLRIGRYRIIYRSDDAGAEIIAIGPRKTIYDETTKQVTAGSGKK